jgi:hypothetical protein
VNAFNQDLNLKAVPKQSLVTLSNAGRTTGMSGAFAI